MGVLRVLIFDRHYRCRLDRQYHAGRPTHLRRTESTQLLLGLTYSLRTMLGRLAPTRDRETMLSYQTNRYRLLFMETAVGWRFVVLLAAGKSQSMTSASAAYEGHSVNLENALRVFFATVFVTWIVMNPLVQPHPSSAIADGMSTPSESDIDTFHSAGFRTKMDEFFALPIFS